MKKENEGLIKQFTGIQEAPLTQVKVESNYQKEEIRLVAGVELA